MPKIQPQTAQKPLHQNGSCTIRLPISETDYERFVKDRDFARTFLEVLMEQHPEVFPEPMRQHYVFYGFTASSRKLGLRCRRVRLQRRSGPVFTLAPAFVLPYMSARTEEVEAGLLLLRFHVPPWVVAYVCGRSAMYWYRLQCALGRFSVVGTTVKQPEGLPAHVVADEKHTRLRGRKAFVAMTAGSDCILGASLSHSASEDALKRAYGVFAEEAMHLKPDYHPETVNTDGWPATQNAWRALFAAIVVIQCFLHAFLKIRACATKHLARAFDQVGDKVWSAYRAETKRSFSQRLRRLRDWAQVHLEASTMKRHVLELCRKRARFALSYDHPGTHRTSNMVDRLMKVMDRAFFTGQYFHGSAASAELRVRSLALLWNFCPSSPATVRKHEGQLCPAERLNGYRYSDKWLENLLVSASMNGYRDCQPNPV